MTMELTPRDIVKGLLDAAASKAPGGIGTVIQLIIDNLIFPHFLDGWLFPKPDTDIFKQFEERIEKMIDKQLEAAVGQATFERVKTRLTGLGDAFEGFANVVDFAERRVRLGYLLTLADATVAEVEAVPDRYLYLLTDPLQIVAILNIAVLLDQVKMYPDHYEHQLALNKAAIRYSDLAGRIRDRFLWYRLGQIAEGKGVIEQKDVNKRQLLDKPAQKKVRFIAYDDFAYWWTNPYGYTTDFLDFLTTDWVLANADSPEFHAKRQEAAANVAKYGEKEKQKVYDWWDEHLTKTTAEFMKFVDWPGEKGERTPKDRMAVQAFPVQPVAAVSDKATMLDRIDLCIGQQMDQFTISGPRYVQTYRLPGIVKFGEQGNMFHRADTYDTAVAAIYLTLRGNLKRACDLADGLCAALEHDSLGGGRIVAATKATAVIDSDNNYATSVFYPDGATRDIGNMCWAGFALTRIYAKTHQYRYLYNALLIGNWITANCAVADTWQGFSGGEEFWGSKRLWRSVEHNIDVYALFLNLYALTRDAAWQDAANKAKTLVMASRLPAGYYVTGTGNDQTLNDGVVPTDTQSWSALAGINPDGNAQSLQYMLDNFATTTNGYRGFKFALAGSGVQNEVTAGAAMALHLQGGAFRERAAVYYDSLERQQKSATNTDGLGLVATPGPEADTGQGLGWKYFNWLHVASTAWTGLAFLARDNAYANPYQTVQLDK
jgi:hypothetical protein